MNFISKWWTTEYHDDKPKVPVRIVHSRTYRKPVIEGEIKGKLNRKFARRNKIRAMKAAGHLRGDNRPFEV